MSCLLISSQQLTSILQQEMAACHFCLELLSDFNTIVDQIKLIIRLITLTLQQDRTRETNERLQMLRSHLVEQNENIRSGAAALKRDAI